MEGGREINVRKIFDAKAVAKNGSVVSDPIDLQGLAEEGAFALQYGITSAGAAELTFTYLSSADGETFVDPTGASDIATSVTPTSGTDSDGKDLLQFSPAPCRWMKIKAVEGDVASATLTAWLVIQ